MTRQSFSSWLVALASVALVSTSCTPPPDAEKTAAGDAVEQAKAAGADMYAKTQLDAATSEWMKAEQHMTAKEYVEAKAAYEKTVTLAAGAGKEAGVQKEMVKEEVGKNLADFMTKWAVVSAAIEKGKGKAAKDLAVEAGEYAKTLTEKLNGLKEAGQWMELKATLEEANMKADEYMTKTAG